MPPKYRLDPVDISIFLTLGLEKGNTAIFAKKLRMRVKISNSETIERLSFQI